MLALRRFGPERQYFASPNLADRMHLGISGHKIFHPPSRNGETPSQSDLNGTEIQAKRLSKLSKALLCRVAVTRYLSVERIK
jgi:hypothetical protein